MITVVQTKTVQLRIRGEYTCILTSQRPFKLAIKSSISLKFWSLISQCTVINQRKGAFNPFVRVLKEAYNSRKSFRGKRGSPLGIFGRTRFSKPGPITNQNMYFSAVPFSDRNLNHGYSCTSPIVRKLYTLQHAPGQNTTVSKNSRVDEFFSSQCLLKTHS